MKPAAFFVLLCVGCTIADAQSVTTGQDHKSLLTQLRVQQREIEILTDLVKGLEVSVGTLKSHKRITINPTNGVVPVRSSANSFADSPLSVDVNGHLQIGNDQIPDSGNTGLTIIGTGDSETRGILEVHNNFANGAEFFTHADAGNLAPYAYFYKSRGSQLSPEPLTRTGYERDSMGGLQFGGWDGSRYMYGAAIFTQSDENWDNTHHGGHISIYGTDVAAGQTPREIMAFGGTGPNGEPNTNIISYRGIAFGGAQSGNPLLSYSSNPPAFRVIQADGSGDAGLTVGSLAVTSPHIPTTAFDDCLAGTMAWDQHFVYVCVAPGTWRRSALSSW
jgi:hypothetical protein